ncbi:short-subunit dehydrogenase [Pseudomonas protegens]|jgi:NAD(P)-dependent dehydrogenase (short-subunit alcohol dehydrogenase family)|uniref:SDR family NAD(P)-dependent oxidoreductase n=1 Tax=Pseudomonas TaxID=286 RepID=UPI000806FD69|nr:MULTISPECIES: SDR family NAD(P)-dependent oxidoreductase [Pseudomonas]BCQ64740.1 short-chain dehydrogenase [Pseudomonas sp. Boi14]MBP5096328.1 SDR family NAD(P)-dependent oxidoreductase [Pseudomonas protegens]MBP5103488.1 SDR family NAD(P)-dependent oxidoreductase [Pseudomonas protegens]MBP5117172.1 SDR family NAD(P)-dependent oxidoreductase [Pseudomonas protegens]MBP5122117.1 SDR family NAD(P)-dependent oxidoreductase [Pseudomonas protegens]
MKPAMPRRVWLTGASSGIGAALAEELLKAGAQLALSARSREPLEALAKRYPGRVLVVPGDLTDALQVREIGKRIAQAWGALDTVILNAGTCEYIEVQQFDAALIERVLNTNLLAASYCIEAALPLLRAGNRPYLVGVASSVTCLPLPRAGAYGASKAALRYLLQSLRIDLAAEGIDVTLVSPGFVDTPLTARNDFPMPMRWTAEQAARHIHRHLGRRPLEIAFPGLFIFGLKLLAWLPGRLQLGIARRLARSGETS